MIIAPFNKSQRHSTRALPLVNLVRGGLYVDSQAAATVKTNRRQTERDLEGARTGWLIDGRTRRLITL